MVLIASSLQQTFHEKNAPNFSNFWLCYQLTILYTAEDHSELKKLYVLRGLVDWRSFLG